MSDDTTPTTHPTTPTADPTDPKTDPTPDPMPEAAATQGATFTRVYPTLQAHDPQALLDFLVTALGFVENAAYRDDDGVIVHAQLDWPGGGGVMFGSYKPGTPWCREPGTTGAYLVTDDIDARYAQARAAGARIVRELGGTDYGSREFAVSDPEGNLWSLGTYRGEPHRA